MQRQATSSQRHPSPSPQSPRVCAAEVALFDDAAAVPKGIDDGRLTASGRDDPSDADGEAAGDCSR